MSQQPTQQSETPELKPSQNKESRTPSKWVKYPWDKDECLCVSCTKSMMLNDGCEWDDEDDFNLCHECSIAELKSSIEQLTALTAEVERLKSENTELHQRLSKFGGHRLQTNSLVTHCKSCGICLREVMGYVCQNQECPVGLGPIMC